MAMAAALLDQAEDILKANEADLRAALKKGLPKAFVGAPDIE